MLNKLGPMKAEGKRWRAWLVPICLLTAVVVGGVFPGRAAQQTDGPTITGTSGPQASAFSPDSALPPSTPAFSPLGPDLVGQVLSTRGDPILGARVLIDAAGPRVGRGYT